MNTPTIRQRRYKRTSTVDEYGIKARIADRRRQALALRAQGRSYRGIAEELGIDVACAFRDCNQALEQFAGENSAEAVKQELLQTLRLATGHLVRDIEQQAAAGGQVETVTNAAGDTVVKVKAWLNVATISELGRTCSRIAALLGIGEAGPDSEGAASFSATTINLVSPGSAAEFATRAQQLAAARAEPAPIDVSVAQATPEPASTPPEASAQPEPATEPSEPLWRQNLRARRAAREAAQSQEQGNAPAAEPEAGQRGRQRPSVRFLAPPQRN